MKYKYYFRKPKAEIVKDILKWLALAGMILIAGQSPYFALRLWQTFVKWLRNPDKYPKKKVYDTFWRLKQRGLIEIIEKNKQIYIRLTEEGKKLAGWLQIDALKIKRPKKWDGKWRILIFDIPQMRRLYRDALRSKLKELGFYQLQKSVWIFPFECRDEVELLRDFFGLSQKEMRLIVAKDIGPDEKLREIFKI